MVSNRNLDSVRQAVTQAITIQSDGGCGGGGAETQEQKEDPCYRAGGVREGPLEDATLNLRYLVICKRRRQEGCSRQRSSLGRKCPSLRGQQIARGMDRGDSRVRAGAQALQPVGGMEQGKCGSIYGPIRLLCLNVRTGRTLQPEQRTLKGQD